MNIPNDNETSLKKIGFGVGLFSFWNSIVVAALLTFLVPFFSSKVDVFASFTDKINLAVQDAATLIRAGASVGRVPNRRPTPASTIVYSEQSRANSDLKRDFQALAQVTDIPNRMPTTVDIADLVELIAQARSADVKAVSIDLTVSNEALFEQIAKMEPLLDSSGSTTKFSMPLKHSLLPELATGSDSIESTGCLTGKRIGYVDFPISKAEILNNKSLGSILNFSHSELRFLGRDQVVRGFCLFQSYRLNEYGSNVKITLPSLSLSAYALSHKKMTGGQLNDDGGIDRAVRCIAIKLGSLEAITKQMQRKSLNPLADAALDCQISQEELKPFLSLLDRPIRSDFSVYRCTTQCESSLDSFSKVAEKIKVPSVLPLQGVVFVGRKDLFATDQVVTPERGATFGIDVQAQNFAALDAGMLDDMFSKESSSKSWSNFFRKALYVTIWSLVLAVTWGVSAMSSTGTQRLIQKYRTKTTTKTKDSKSSLNLMLRNSVFWLVVVVLRTIIVLLGVSLLMICAFLFIGNELFDIRTVNDDIAFTFVTTLLISFGIESILLVASGVEHGTEVASKTLINLKEYVERFRTFLHKGVDK